jgi:hypothetical protein
MKSDQSPCLNCPNNLDGIDKRLCLDHCKRLKAYQNGRDWTKEEYFIVPEGKNLIEEIMQTGLTKKRRDADQLGDALGFEESDETEEIDEEELPSPETYIPPETSWKKTISTASSNRCAICGKPESYDNRFLRGICRNPCYNQWYSGKVEHPVLGKFKTAPKEVISMKKETERGQGRETDRPESVADDICLTTININLELYPQIRETVYRMAVDLSLPVSHVAVTLLAEALGNRRAGAR